MPPAPGSLALHGVTLSWVKGKENAKLFDFNLSMN